MTPGDYVRILSGPHAGEYGYLVGDAPLTLHEAEWAHPPRTLLVAIEETERPLRVAEVEIAE